MKQKKTDVLFLLKSLLIAYTLTAACLILLAFLLYRFSLGKRPVEIGIILIYVLSTFAAGYINGKRAETKKYLWGLCIGCIYFMILVLASLGVHHSVSAAGIRFITTFLLCAGGGMLGGMLS